MFVHEREPFLSMRRNPGFIAESPSSREFTVEVPSWWGFVPIMPRERGMDVKRQTLVPHL
jgi:hypothetical protein